MVKNPVGYKFHEIFDVKVDVVDEINEIFDVKVGGLSVTNDFFDIKVGVFSVTRDFFDVKVGVLSVTNDFFNVKNCVGNRKVFVPEDNLPVFSTNFLKFLTKNPRQESQFFDGSLEVQSTKIGSRVSFPLFALTIQFQPAEQLF